MTKEEAEIYWNQFYKNDLEAYDFAYNLMKKKDFRDTSSLYGWDVDEKIKFKKCNTPEEEFKNSLPCSIATINKRDGKREFKINNKKYKLIENKKEDDFVFYDVTKKPICVDPHYVRVENTNQKEREINLFGIKVTAKYEENGDLLLKANDLKQLYVSLLSLSEYEKKYKGKEFKNDAKILIGDNLSSHFGIEKGVVLSTFNNDSEKLLALRNVVRKPKTKYKYNPTEQILLCFDEEQSEKERFIKENRMTNLQKYYVIVKIRNGIAKIDVDFKDIVKKSDIKIDLNKNKEKEEVIDLRNEDKQIIEEKKEIENNIKSIPNEPVKEIKENKEINERKDIKEIIRMPYKTVDGNYGTGKRKDIIEKIRTGVIRPVQPIQKVEEEIKKKETREIKIKELQEEKIEDIIEEYQTPFEEDKEEDIVDDKVIGRPKSPFDTLILNPKYIKDLEIEKEKHRRNKVKEEEIKKKKLEEEELLKEAELKEKEEKLKLEQEKKEIEENIKKLEEEKRKKEEKERLEKDKKELEEKLKLEQEKRELEEKINQERLKQIEQRRKNEEKEKEELAKLEKERKEKAELEEKIKKEKELEEAKKKENSNVIYNEEKVKEIQEEKIKPIHIQEEKDDEIAQFNSIEEEEEEIIQEVEEEPMNILYNTSDENNEEENEEIIDDKEEFEDNNISEEEDIQSEILEEQEEEQIEEQEYNQEEIKVEENTEEDKEDMLVSSSIQDEEEEIDNNDYTFEFDSVNVNYDQDSSEEENKETEEIVEEMLPVNKLDIKEVDQEDISDYSKLELKKITARQLFKKIYGEKNQTVLDFANRLIKFSDYENKDSEYGWGMILFDENKEPSIENVVIANLSTLEEFNMETSFISNGHNFYVNKVGEKYLIESDDILTNPYSFYEVKRLAKLNYAKVQKVLYIYIKCLSLDGLEISKENFNLFVDIIQRSLQKMVLNSFLNMEVGKDYIYIAFNSEASDSYKEVYDYTILLNSYRKELKKEKIINSIIVLNACDLPYSQIHNTTDEIATKDKEFRIIKEELGKRNVDISIKRAIHIGPQIINYLNIDRNLLNKSLIGQNEDIEEFYECKYVYELNDESL